jgi:hypothetical protein
MNYRTITQVATSLNFSADDVVKNYRHAAYSAAYALNFNRFQLIRFVRECLTVKGVPIDRNQYDLALEILEQEGLL